MKKKFHGHRAPMTEEARGNDAGVIENHNIAAPKKPGEFMHGRVMAPLIRYVQKTRLVTRCARAISDAVRRQFKIKEVNPHGVGSQRLEFIRRRWYTADQACRPGAGPYSQQAEECNR